MTDQTATTKPHFDIILEKTNVCPCEMEATFKAFFKTLETEFDGQGYLNIKEGDIWRQATGEEIRIFIENFKK